MARSPRVIFLGARRSGGRRRGGGRRRKVRHSKRGVGGVLGKVISAVTRRPLKVVSIALGIGAVGEVVLGGSSTNDGNGVPQRVMFAIQAAQQGNMAQVANNIQLIPKDLIAGVMSGNWIAPAAGAAITGWLSRTFKI